MPLDALGRVAVVKSLRREDARIFEQWASRRLLADIFLLRRRATISWVRASVRTPRSSLEGDKRWLREP